MKKLNLIKASLLIALQLPLYSFASANKTIDDLAKSFMQINKVQGLSIAVINKDKISTYNYGYANEISKTPTTNDTIYRVASFSKPYTATLAAIASTEGRLDLDAPFAQYFPDLKANPKLDQITTSMLLAHVSSFPFDFDPTPKTYAEIIQDYTQYTPSNPPGSQYGYSNAGIGTVGYILQNAYAQSYDDILAQKLAKPLNLNSTYLNLPKAKEKYVALGHDSNNKLRPYDRSIDIWFAAASLKSNISDMAKFLNAQINYTEIKSSNLSKAIALVHQSKYCFANKLACEQLAWQAHIISELQNSNGDTFSKADGNGGYSFATQKLATNNDFSKNKIFVDKTCGGYGMSGYMVYIPDKKTGVVILLNKLVGDSRVKLGRDILKSLN